MVLDYNADDQVVGIEIVQLSKRVPNLARRGYPVGRAACGALATGYNGNNLEHRPALPEGLAALARHCREVVVLPLFLFAAGHVKNDLPLALAEARRAFPATRFGAARALGVGPRLVDLAHARARPFFDEAPRKTAVVVVGRGSSDPDANGDFCKMVWLLGEGRDLAWVVPGFIGITRPSFEEAIELLARARPARIVVIPYFLFAGRLIERLGDQVEAFRARYTWMKTRLAPHLGPDGRLFSLIDERLREALDGRRPLPCDNCQYRLPVAGVSEHVGGLKALLWSLRHGSTHTQAMPHFHAHQPLTKHVLVCGNVDCAERGSVPLIATLRRLVRAAGRDRDIRVTRTHCMGRCGEGPTVAVYPEGIWYRCVRETDAEELFREHLLNDRLVARLVDKIMQ